MKIALVWFLEGALLRSDPKKNISEFHLSLVDELTFSMSILGAKLLLT